MGVGVDESDGWGLFESENDERVYKGLDSG